MAPSDRLNQVNKHLNYPAGLLAGQVAIITGAGQGIGAEAARLFANEGAKVVVADIDAGMFFAGYYFPDYESSIFQTALPSYPSLNEAEAKALNRKGQFRR